VKYWPLPGSLYSTKFDNLALDNRGKIRLIIPSHNPDWRIEESQRARVPFSLDRAPSTDQVVEWLAEVLAKNRVRL
jgi:hypothetical protein